MLKILTHNRPNSLQYYSSETIQVSAKKVLIHALVHSLFSYTHNILLTDIHTFHIKQVSFCSTTGRGWPFWGASCHCTKYTHSLAHLRLLQTDDGGDHFSDKGRCLRCQYGINCNSFVNLSLLPTITLQLRAG